MLTARSHRFSLIVHAIDDSGALCGARPKGGDWIASTRIPLNCPTCLVKSGLPRYAYCELPVAVQPPMRHIRQVGPEGMSKTGVVGGTRTLCNRVSGWDVSMVAATPAPGTSGLCPSCVSHLRGRRTGLVT